LRLLSKLLLRLLSKLLLRQLRKLLLRLLSKLLLRPLGKLLLGLLSKLLLRTLGKLLLRLLGKLLLLLEKWRILSKVLLLLRILSKLLALELSRLLELLLLLLALEVSEVLVKVLTVELFRGRTVWVEVGGVEDWPPRPLPAVGKVLSLGRSVVLTSDLLLLLHDGLLEGNHSLVSLFLKLESGISLLGGSLGLSQGVNLDQLKVRLEAGAVVGGVLHDLDLAVLIQKSVFAFDIPLSVLGLQPERSVTRLEADGVGAVLVDLIDLLDNDHRGLGGGGRGRDRRAGLCCVYLSAALGGFLGGHQASKEN